MWKLLAKPLARNEQEEIVANKLAWILRVAQPKKVLLFGSAARYEMTDMSDVDLMIVFRDDQNMESIKAELFKARPKDDWPHDLLIYTEAEFAASVAKGGGAAYLAQKEGRVLFSNEVDP